MKKMILPLAVTVLAVALYSFKYVKFNDSEEYFEVVTEAAEPNWDNYKSWFQITKDKPNTGDPVGLLDGKHKGEKGYREIYINKIGEAEWKKGGSPDYPEGTIIVKEQYGNQKKWEKGGKASLTVMVKLAEGESPASGDWGWAMGKGKVKSGPKGTSKFCTKCHVMGQANDYTFMTKDFVSNN
ncbi:MAG: cytochrome P460 family protein [Flavobacteriaceae bacterium]|nr:cytochrome P460 family protein [Flavobacteriaceae bacterium]